MVAGEALTRALLETGRDLLSTLDPGEVGRRIVDRVPGLLAVRLAAVYLLEHGSGRLSQVASATGPEGEFTWVDALEPGTGLASVALREGRAVWSPDVLADPRVAYASDVAARVRAAAHRALAAVPLIVHGRAIGALVVADSTGRRFEAPELDLVETFGQQAALALDNARLHEEARQARDLLQSISDDSADAIVTADLAGRITSWSRAAEEISGRPAHEAVGRPVNEVWDIGCHRLREIDRALETKGRLSGEEATVSRPDGSVAQVIYSMARLRDRDGTPAGTVAILRDVTDQKRSAEALARSEKLTLMGSLLAGVAHELNNPLAVAMGQAALLSEALASRGDDTLGARAAKIVQATERACHIVGTFLAMARQRPTERRPTSLSDVAREALDLMAYPLRVDSVTVERALDDGLPPVSADPHQLHQVLVNLISNAHQAMRAVRPTARKLAIAAGHDRAADQVWVEVADTGPGVPPEIAERIFEAFFTTKPEGQGTGLGLSLCRGIVASHGGTLALAPRAGWGAVFRVTLPVGQGSGALEAAPGKEDTMAFGAEILLVEDEDDVGALVADMLEGDGHRITRAANGAEALARVAGRDFDVILSDIRMPDMDGLGLHRELIARRPELARRMIFVTGDALTPETQRFLAQAGTQSLAKPFSLRELREALAGVLGAAPAGADYGRRSATGMRAPGAALTVWSRSASAQA